MTKKNDKIKASGTGGGTHSILGVPTTPTPQPQHEITDDQLFEQIMINQRKMANTLLSFEAEIKRLKFRVDRLEREP